MTAARKPDPSGRSPLNPDRFFRSAVQMLLGVGFTLKQLSEACGVDVATMQAYADGESSPPVAVGQRLRAYLDRKDSRPEWLEEARAAVGPQATGTWWRRFGKRSSERG